ncbi:MAG: 4-hydroxy-3-methylbut-2-enyl diphosphate reductase [Bacteroidetes bacterium]|jgi:4-hydroxy-3-methylbut-2-enyl diphosphate reductase|nr:4-hydroxy-3-methylbut-2-enyl diphosphate reductase [Bacteroidota bacterium]
MHIEIESSSGFCFGVLKAVEKAEAGLKEHEQLYCLGAIVHNEEETKRLQQQGLIPIDYDTFRQLKNTRVLLRAHGEPPETYQIARKNNIELIDGTCPIVLKLQQRVKNILKDNPATNVIIFGKKNHPEVIGLSGQVSYKTQIVSSIDEIDKLDLTPPVHLLSQTTMPREEYETIQLKIHEQLTHQGINVEENLKCMHSVCGKVANRRQKVREFSEKQDVVIFVAGRESSNGKQLYEVCSQANPNCYYISSLSEIEKSWFINAEKTGICGATSTPQWLMQNVADEIVRMIN